MEENKRRYIIIKETGEIDYHEMPFKKKWDLPTLQKNVGGYIEAVQLKIQGKKYSGWANEEGLQKNLSINTKATTFYQEYHKKDGIALVGPVIVENFKGDHTTI